MPAEIKYTVYILLDPRNNQVKYVGMTQKSLGVRLTQHLNDINNREKWKWIEELRREGAKPLIQAIEADLTQQDADERETYWIKHYLSTGALTNIGKIRVYNRHEDILQRNDSGVLLSQKTSNEENRTQQEQSQIDESQSLFPENAEGIYMSMHDAAKQLDISYYKLSQLVIKKAISTQSDILNQRTKLVEINEVKRIFRLK